jgi:Cell division protein
VSWSGRYLRRVLGRNLGRSFLSLMLAALLAFAFGLLTVLRSIYGELYQHVEVKPIVSGIGYERAQKIERSGLVRDPYYETRSQDSQIQMEDAPVYLVNRLDKLVHDPVEWAEGWDAEAFGSTQRLVCVMYAEYAEILEVGLGDRVRVNEKAWLANLSMNGNPFEPGETVEELRDRRRPFFTVIGLIQADIEDRTVFAPVGANINLSCLFPVFLLDIAEYTLTDYHRSAELTAVAKEAMDGGKGSARFHMDTSNADRIYKIHRLIETLYPLTIAAALLLAGVLPGLTVLHASREISILRALGTKAGRCVGIYTLTQVLCALTGLVLGLALALMIQRPDLRAVARPFGGYLVAHLTACALGSGVFAWLCARKHVLAQLQAKE